MMFSILFMILTLTPFCFGNRLRQLQTLTNDLQKRLEAQEAKTRDLQQNLQTAEAKSNSLQTGLKAQEAKTDDLQKRLEAEEAATAATAETLFLAHLLFYSNSIPSGSVIVWDTVLINPGGHYSNVTGGYTAPYNGYYQFSVAKDSNKYSAYFHLTIDNETFYFNELQTAEKHYDYVSSTATINVQLNKGQVVKVQNFVSDKVYGSVNTHMLSFFTGYMIAAL